MGGTIRGRLRSAALFASTLALVAGANAAEGQESPEPLLANSGRALFVRYCSSCHGPDAKGDGPAAPALRPPPADLTTIQKRLGGSFPAASVARYIDGRSEITAHGSRDMPIWGLRFGEGIVNDTAAEEVTRGNISVLVDYLRTIQVTD